MGCVSLYSKISDSKVLNNCEKVQFKYGNKDNCLKNKSLESKLVKVKNLTRDLNVMS